MDGPQQDASAPIFTVSRDGACNDDVQLLRRIGQGDEDAMAAFYREHGRIVLSQVLLVAGDRVLAEEIVQDTMLAVWRGAGSFRGESSVRSWVIAIARRQTRDRLRGRRLRVVDDTYLADQPSSGPGPEVMALDRAERCDPGTSHLPPGGAGPGLRHRAQPPRGRRRTGDPGRDREEPPHRGAHRTQPGT
jgi:RNA polymerase sigma factor (sigma-70 family)